MNSFSQEIDDTLQLYDLETLESRLELPKGWMYSSYLLEKDFSLVYAGVGIIIQDELCNRYSMVA
jgi:hypothetical protein